MIRTNEIISLLLLSLFFLFFKCSSPSNQSEIIGCGFSSALPEEFKYTETENKEITEFIRSLESHFYADGNNIKPLNIRVHKQSNWSAAYTFHHKYFSGDTEEVSRYISVSEPILGDIITRFPEDILTKNSFRNFQYYKDHIEDHSALFVLLHEIAHVLSHHNLSNYECNTKEKTAIETSADRTALKMLIKEFNIGPYVVVHNALQKYGSDGHKKCYPQLNYRDSVLRNSYMDIIRENRYSSLSWRNPRNDFYDFMLTMDIYLNPLDSTTLTLRYHNGERSSYYRDYSEINYLRTWSNVPKASEESNREIYFLPSQLKVDTFEFQILKDSFLLLPEYFQIEKYEDYDFEEKERFFIDLHSIEEIQHLQQLIDNPIIRLDSTININNSLKIIMLIDPMINDTLNLIFSLDNKIESSKSRLRVRKLSSEFFRNNWISNNSIYQHFDTSYYYPLVSDNFNNNYLDYTFAGYSYRKNIIDSTWYSNGKQITPSVEIFELLNCGELTGHLVMDTSEISCDFQSYGFVKGRTTW